MLHFKNYYLFIFYKIYVITKIVYNRMGDENNTINCNKIKIYVSKYFNILISKFQIIFIYYFYPGSTRESHIDIILLTY